MLDATLKKFRAWKRRLALAQAYQRLFALPEGELVLYDILRAGGILEIGHEPGDPYTSAVNVGRRSLALYLLEQLRWTEGEIVKLAQSKTAETLNAIDEEMEA